MSRLIIPIVIGLTAILMFFIILPTAEASGGSWLWDKNGDILQIHYGSGTDWPQYGALHLNSSYFRLIPSRTSGWGTSVVLLPSFWITATQKYLCPPAGLCQGGQVTYNAHVEGQDLVISTSGTITGLNVSSEIRLSPPVNNTISAQVSTTVNSGSVELNLADHQEEAFKSVMLSSMHISSSQWDTQAAYLGCRTFSIPDPIPVSHDGEWIIQPQSPTTLTFGLLGGTSDWKKNAPTIEVNLEETLAQATKIAGWKTRSNDPNDDNVGLWAASDSVLSSWNYQFTARSWSTVRCLSVSKHASSSPVQDGALLTYTIHITNIGDVDLNAIITDTLPEYVVSPDPILTWTDTITPDQTWMRQVTVTVQNGYTGTLINMVQVTTQEGPTGMARATVCSNKCLYYLPIIFKNSS